MFFIIFFFDTKSANFRAVKEGIIAAIEGIGENARFGLVTFSNKIGIWNLKNLIEKFNYEEKGIPKPSSEPIEQVFTHVNYLPITDSPISTISIDQILPFDDFLVPVSFQFQFHIYFIRARGLILWLQLNFVTKMNDSWMKILFR